MIFLINVNIYNNLLHGKFGVWGIGFYMEIFYSDCFSMDIIFITCYSNRGIGLKMNKTQIYKKMFRYI